VNFKGPFGQILSEILLKLPSHLHAAVHFGLEHFAAAAAQRLGLVQGHIGAAKKLAGGCPVVWYERDANAGCDPDLVAADEDG